MQGHDRPEFGTEDEPPRQIQRTVDSQTAPNHDQEPIEMDIDNESTITFPVKNALWF